MIIKNVTSIETKDKFYVFRQQGVSGEHKIFIEDMVITKVDMFGDSMSVELAHESINVRIENMTNLKETKTEQALGLIDFDLEKALAGEPVVTRDGREIKEIVGVSKDETVKYPVAVRLGSSSLFSSFTRDGKITIGQDSGADLFMKPTKKTLYINLYKNPDGEYKAYVYETDVEVEYYWAGTPPHFLGTYPITIDE